MFCLDIGPGNVHLEPAADWYTLDVKPPKNGFRQGADCMRHCGQFAMDRIGEWGTGTALPFPLASFDLIHASHVLEHIRYDKTETALKQAFDLLKPGGILEIHVPDFDALVYHYQHRREIGRWRPVPSDAHPMLSLNCRLFSHGPNAEDWHKAVFDHTFLKEHFQKAGFVEIKSPVPIRGHNHGILNLSMSGMKPPQ